MVNSTSSQFNGFVGLVCIESGLLFVLIVNDMLLLFV